MREVSQRFWDAMIIKAWHDFDHCNTLAVRCFHEFGDYPQNLPLLRNKNYHGTVRSWVDIELHSLSEKLWDLPKERHVELLNWLEKNKLDCVTHRTSKRHFAEAYGAARRGGKSMGKTLFEAKIYKEGHSRMAQVNVVKAVRSKA
jgi:hypothetical protein